MAKYTLMAHQKKAVKFISKMDGVAALLFDPGTGKTGAALSWIDQEVAKHGDFRVLVVAPMTAADTWVLQPSDFMDSTVKARFLRGSTREMLKLIRESRNWGSVPDTKIQSNHSTRKGAVSGNRVTILSVSAGSVSSFCGDRVQRVALIRAVKAYDPHLIIVDESQIIKAPTSTISTALYQIGQIAPHRLILTGTVNPLNRLDVYGQWRFLAPWTFSDQHGAKMTKRPHRMTDLEKKSIKPWVFGKFKARYAVPGGYEGRGIKKFRKRKELDNRIAERSMVVRKEDVLDLPPVTDIDIHITLSPREQKAYDEMRKELATLIESGELIEAPNALSKMMKLRQIHAGFIKDSETGEIHVIGTTLQKAVAEIVNVQLADETRVVVFAFFKPEIEALAKALKKKGRTVEVVTGSTKPDERLAIRKRFGDLKKHPEPIVLVAQVKTMSISVNELVTAQHAVYASRSNQRVDEVQSRDRLDRKGQTKPVTFWNVFAPGLISEIMRDTHKENGDMEKTLLNHIMDVRNK